VTPNRRRLLLAIAAVCTVAAALHASENDAPTERATPVAARPDRSAPIAGEPAAPRARGVTKAEALPVLDLERLQRANERAAARGAPVDAFAPRDWQQPEREAQARAAAAQPPPPPPPPQAPPLPFTYLGTMQDGGRTTVFLAQGARSHLVAPGDTIDARWRLDAVTERALLITYVPLGIQQTLPLGGLQ